MRALPILAAIMVGCSADQPSAPEPGPQVHIVGWVHLDGEPVNARVQLLAGKHTDTAADDELMLETYTEPDGTYILESDLGCGFGPFVGARIDGVLNAAGDPTWLYDDESVRYCRNAEINFDFALPPGYSGP